MAKRSKKKTGIIAGFVAFLLVLALMIPLITNYDTLFGSEEPPVQEENNGSGTGNDVTSTDKVKVYFGDVLVKSGEPVQSTQSETSFSIVCKEEYQASFVVCDDYNRWTYLVDDLKASFRPNVDVLEKSISNGTATIWMPFDIMEWVLLQHYGVTQEQVTLPTDVDHNVAYIALKIVVGEESFLYPIKFNLNGVWTKCKLDKDEIVFCD